ncbi:MAG: helix-turn-helix domain-containing protein [Dehalococcoidia bacterium]
MTTTANVEALLVSVEEAAAALGVARTTAWELVRSGALPSCKIGARRLVSVSALRVYAAGLVEQAAGR